MKALFVRLGVLGTLVVLGWITIAKAQRGETPNPLREPVPSVESTTADPPPSEPARKAEKSESSRPPATDPFAPRAERRQQQRQQQPARAADSIPDASAIGLAAPARSRYADRATPVSAEQPAGGPSLSSGTANPPADNRYSARSADRAKDRYSSTASSVPSASESREPAPFRADPSAAPASPMHPIGQDHEFTSPPEAARAPEFPAEPEGSGQPGDPRLDGVQSPQLSIRKFAPKEIQVGKPAVFRVTVRNTGSATAREVEIYDQVPKGTRLMSTTPQSRRGPQGEIIWSLGTIQPGEEAKVEMQLMPTTEGEIGSVATVHFGADAAARCVATRPQLVVETAAPKRVLIGDQVTLSITISNPGTGTATGVVLEERIPAGLQHPAGAELEYRIGDLKPGETRKLDLPMVANRAGAVTNLLSAKGDGSLRAESKCDLEVTAPQLDVAVEGPRRRYLERQATYQFSVSNPGTAAARHVELIASLPPGLKFVKANNAGYYEESTRTVRWRLEELPANETGSVELVALPVEAGQHAMRLRGTAQKGLVAEKEQPVLIEGIAAILFQVADTADPVEVGGQTTFEVHVVNQGSKAATNVRLSVDLPAELRPLAAEGPTRYAVSGGRVIFDGLGQLPPKADTTFRIRVKASRPGDLRTRFQLVSDDMQTPVTKEESTRVYGDE